MKKYRGIITDIDGTMTPMIRHAFPSERVTASIKKAAAKGYAISLASGRPYFLVEYLVDHLGQVGPCIVDNGAVIIDSRGKTLWEALLPTPQANEILQLTQRLKLVKASCDTGVLDNPRKIPSSSKVRKLSAHDIKLDEAEEIINIVSTKFDDVAVVKAFSYADPNLTDIYFSNGRATKQFAIVKMCELLKISPQDMICIGDGYNDFPLLMACGHRVAMGNAVDELKQIADEIAPSVEEDGLAYIIEKYLS